MSRVIITATALVLAATGLVGCSSSSVSAASAPASQPAASASLVGGTAVCDEPSLRAAIEGAYSAEGADVAVLAIDEFTCEDGWAVVFADTGQTEEDAVTVTEVLEAEGQFWIVKDRMDVCGTPAADGSGARPDDAQVPAGIYADACDTN